MVAELDPEANRVLHDLRRAATRRGRASLGAFGAEGLRIVRRGLEAGHVPRALLVETPRSAESSPDLAELCQRVQALGRPCFAVPAATLRELAEGRNSGCVQALFDLPEPLAVAEVLTTAAQDATFLVLVDVRDPGNVGALLRTALASGVHAVIGSPAADPFHPRAVRTSQGSVFKMPAAQFTDLSTLAFQLRQQSVHCLAAVAGGGAALDAAGWPAGKLALWVGNEGAGLSAEQRSAADTSVKIDLSDRADSYCVNSAAAVCLYEIQRRRRASAGVRPTRRG